MSKLSQGPKRDGIVRLYTRCMGVYGLARVPGKLVNICQESSSLSRYNA